MPSSLLRILLPALPVFLAACSGSSGNGTDDPGNGDPTPAPARELMVGYYAEDPVDNPEDPTFGTLYLDLPEGDGAFNGTMSFTYLGCQSASVGTISGVKTADTLAGEWSGTVDGTDQEGFYEGDYDEDSASYIGTYTVSGGKQPIDIPGCVDYYIASHGSWRLFAPGTTLAGLDSVDIDGGDITWAPPAGTLFSLVSIIDVDNALGSASNPIPWQTLAFGQTASVTVPAGVLTGGREYIVGVASRDEETSLTYYSSQSFVAP